MNWHQRFARYYEEVLKANAQTSSRSLVEIPKLFAKQVACDLQVLGVSFDDSLAKDTIVFDVRIPTAEMSAIESDDDPAEEEIAAWNGETLELWQGPDIQEITARSLEAKAARKIHRTQTQDPYNRETLLGAPLVCLVFGSRRVVGPLLYWDVDIAYDPGSKRVTIAKRTAVPEFNTMLLDPFLEEGQGMGDIVGQVRPVLIECEPGPVLVSRVIEVVSGLIDDLADFSFATAEDSPARGWATAGVNKRGVLVNTTKSNAFLLNDLRDIAKMESGSGPLDLLTRTADSERDPAPPDLPYSFSDSAGGQDPLFFPFDSNPAQRRIAAMADRATVLTVQGPPGTGKSHTIANLVCHLAASNKSVLVTSHQRKAVEVVTDLLKPMPGLAMSAAGGDRKSTQELRTRIRGLLEDNSLRVGTEEEAVRRGSAALAQLDQELRLLAHRFQELRRKEHEGWDGLRTYAELRVWDKIEPDDRPLSVDAERIEAYLPEWFDCRRALAGVYEPLAALLCTEGPGTAGTTEARVLVNLRKLVEIARSFQASPAGDEVKRVKEYCERAEPGTSTDELVSSLLHWFENTGRNIVDAAEQAGVSVGATHPLGKWTSAARRTEDRLLTDLEERATAIVDRFEDRARFSDNALRLTSTVEAEKLGDAVDCLRRASGGFIRWHFSGPARRSRRLVESVLGRVPERDAIQTWSGQIDRAIARFELEQDAKVVAAEVALCLPEGIDLKVIEPGTEGYPHWRRFVRLVRAYVSLLRLSRTAPANHWEVLARTIDTGQGSAFNRTSLSRIEAVLRTVDGAIEREALINNLREVTPLRPEWSERLDPLIAELRVGRISDTGSALLEELDRLLESAATFRRTRDLERGELSSLPATLHRLLDELDHGADPAWIREHVPDALEAHRLARLIRSSMGTDPDDVASVTESLRKGQRRRKDLIAKLVERRIRLRRARALARGHAAAELQQVGALLAMGGQLRASLVSLRDRIDYGPVLEAFPVWLATIDEACRLFPSKPELFDYIIVDEASQCAQPALLPLALRCRHLIVVGDSKQLRPTFGRFLSQNSLDALRVKHGLAEHRAGIFTSGGDSLLSFAEYKANQSGFLDEHFRCDPSIIAWSNENFYNSSLKVLTHRRPNSFRPALAVRYLTDAEDNNEKKVNIEEAHAVIRELRRLTDDPANANLTIGIISPFRKQADLLQELLEEEFQRDTEVIKRHQLLASTADGFQGDERDIVLYSFRMGPSSKPNTLGTLEREPERFNVAFSRARRLAISFLSTSPVRLPGGGLTRSWIDHSESVRLSGNDGREPGREDRFDSEFERSVCGRLRDHGLTVATQEPCGPFRIDLVVRDTDGRLLAVECDGPWHFDEFGHLRPEDYQRQDLIERAGWVVHRISGRRYLLNPEREIERTIEMLRLQPTEQEQAILLGEGDVEAFAASAPSSDPPAIDVPVEQPGAGGILVLDPAPAPSRTPQFVLGRPLDEARPLILQLVRWSLLGSKVRGSMFDRLIEIDTRIREGNDLREEDISAIEFIGRLAEMEGFQPES